jgi:Flp pilus assembly protein TadD
MHRKSLALEEELGHKEGMASDYGNLGLIYRTRGDLDTAEEMLRKALALFEQVGARPEVEKARRLIAELRPKRGKARKGRKRTRKRKR